MPSASKFFGIQIVMLLTTSVYKLKNYEKDLIKCSDTDSGQHQR